MRLYLHYFVVLTCFLLSSCSSRDQADDAVDAYGVAHIERELKLPSLQGINEDVIRMRHDELYSGSTLSICYVFPQTGKLVFYNVGETEDGENHQIQRETDKRTVAKLMATGFHKCREITFDDSGTTDGEQYVVESLIGSKYKIIGFNNPDNVATKEAQLVVRAMSIIKETFD